MSTGRSHAGDEGAAGWTFLSNHAHVLVCLARDPDIRLRDVADMVGITERSTVKIVSELESAGVVTRTKVGRRNHYEIDFDAQLRHPVEAERTVGSLLEMVLDAKSRKAIGLRKSRA
jgi:DNA-binding Lrp family transcriptional regulator